MEKRLLIELETERKVQTAEGKDVDVQFKFSVPYGIPFDLALSVLEEFANELKDVAQKAADKKEEPSLEEPK